MTTKILSLLVLVAAIGACVATNICRLSSPCTVSYKTIGCFKDSGGDRVLPNYIYNERDSTVSNYGNRKIEWYNWETYVAEFSCRCAVRAHALGYDLIGVQFYGECWAGHSSSSNHARLGTSEKCIGDHYKKCDSNDRYCAGEQWTNFVYKIVDPTCNLEFERIGCYADLHNSGARPLENYVLNDRDPTATASYSGRSIDWVNYDVYLPEFACRCAQKAKENNSTYFGLQFYGECWTHPNGENTFAIDGVTTGCIDNCYQECGGDIGQICIGGNHKNYVYRLKEAGQPSCDVTIESIGCYAENPNDRALRRELKNVKPGSEYFYGRMPVVGQWDKFFPEFLCTCARIVRSNGWTYFGINSYGACVSDIASESYSKHGDATTCREGAANNDCSSSSMLCSGPDNTANYVYKVVTTSSSKRSFIPAKDPSRDEFDFNF